MVATAPVSRGVNRVLVAVSLLPAGRSVRTVRNVRNVAGVSRQRTAPVAEGVAVRPTRSRGVVSRVPTVAAVARTGAVRSGVRVVARAAVVRAGKAVALRAGSLGAGRRRATADA